MTINITVSKNSVYELIEGLTANIGKKNPNAGFEAMWASQGDAATLDIFWDEAKNDLEATVQHWLEGSKEEIGGKTGPMEYTLSLCVSSGWPEDELKTLLTRSVMQYLVHATLAGWLSIMPKLSVDADYGAMATAGLGTVVGLLLKKKTSATVTERHTDSAAQTDVDGSVNAEARHSDSAAQTDVDGSVNAEARHSDSAAQTDADGSVNAEARHSDSAAQTDADGTTCGGARHDDVRADDNDEDSRSMGARHNNRDHVPVRIEHESLNMSGEYGINSINVKQLRHGKETDQNHHQPWRGVPGHHHGLQPDFEAAWPGRRCRD